MSPPIRGGGTINSRNDEDNKSSTNKLSNVIVPRDAILNICKARKKLLGGRGSARSALGEFTALFKSH